MFPKNFTSSLTRIQNKKVSIIIINYNGKNHLTYCLPALYQLNHPNFEVVLVDNFSKDDSVGYVRQHFPQVRIIVNEENLGFAEANDIGFKETEGDYILLLNNDTKIEPNFLSNLVTVLESNTVIGIVQPKIIFMDSGKLQAGGAYLTKLGFLYHFGLFKNPEDPKYNERLEIFSANGSCMLIKREVIEKVGLFDADFFAYFEETDFCWRVWLAGYKIIYCPEAVIFHKGSATASKLNLGFVNFHSFKNRICSLIKNLGIKELVKIFPLHLACVELFSLYQLVGLKFEMFWGLQKALVWNLVNLMRTLDKRSIVQKKIRVLPDSQIMPIIKKSVRPSYFYYLISGLEKYQD